MGSKKCKLGYFPRIFHPHWLVDPKLAFGRRLGLDQVFHYRRGTVPIGGTGPEGEVQNSHVFLQLIFMITYCVVHPDLSAPAHEAQLCSPPIS